MKKINISFAIIVLITLFQSTLHAQSYNLGSGNYIWLNAINDANWTIGKDNSHNVNIFGYGSDTRRFRILNSMNSQELFSVNFLTGNLAVQDNSQIRLRGSLNSETGISFIAPSDELRISHRRDVYDRYISLGSYDATSTWNSQLTLNTKTGFVGIGTGTSVSRSPLEVRVTGNNSSIQTGLIIQQTNPGVPNNSAGVSLDFGIGNNGVNNNIEGRIILKETNFSARPKMIFSLWDEKDTMQDRMVIDTYGNVGIGTTTAQDRVHVLMNSTTNGTGVSIPAAHLFEFDGFK